MTIVTSEPQNSSHDWLPVFVDCPLLAVIPAEDGKLLFPLALSNDLAELLAGHESGALGQVEIETEDGRRWTENRGVALAARSGDADARAAWLGIDLDAAGEGHAGGAPVEAIERAGLVGHRLLKEAGLPSILCRSPGGKGRHIWCLLPCSIKFSTAAWIAEIIAAGIIKEVPEAAPGIERRPSTDRWPGQPLTMPTASRIIDEYRPSHRYAVDALDELLIIRDRAEAAGKIAKAKAEKARREMLTKAPKTGDVESKDVSLVAVAEVAGEIVRKRGAEVHVRCRQCSGTVKVNESKRAWSCFACSIGGVGDAAAYLLAMWLVPDSKPAETFAVLRAAARQEIAK